MARCVLTHTPGLPQSFCEPQQWHTAREGWTLARKVGGKRARGAVCWDINLILKHFLTKAQHSSLTAAWQYEANTGTGWLNEDFRAGSWRSGWHWAAASLCWLLTRLLRQQWEQLHSEEMHAQVGQFDVHSLLQNKNWTWPHHRFYKMKWEWAAFSS